VAAIELEELHAGVSGVGCEVVELLAQSGPALRRPVVGEITTSTYKNMKELRAK
jgi:hypothetical protein